MIIQCCVCKKVRNKSRWIELSDTLDVEARISHGYCPKCVTEAFAEIESCVGESEKNTLSF